MGRERSGTHAHQRADPPRGTALTATAGLVLAAGEGRRFGGPKAPVLWEGERLVDRAVRLLRAGGCDPVVVVLGAWWGEVPDAVAVRNAEWATGMGSSLRVGLEAVVQLRVDDPVDRVVVTLVDLIGLTAVAVERLMHCDARLAAAAYAGQRGHPVMLGREHFDGVSAAAVGDRGARDYLTVNDVALVEVGDVATADDLDVPPAP